jgi:hypothetical protein
MTFIQENSGWLVTFGVLFCALVVLVFSLIKQDKSDWRDLVGRLQ